MSDLAEGVEELCHHGADVPRAGVGHQGHQATLQGVGGLGLGLATRNVNITIITHKKNSRRFSSDFFDNVGLGDDLYSKSQEDPCLSLTLTASAVRGGRMRFLRYFLAGLEVRAMIQRTERHGVTSSFRLEPGPAVISLKT